MPSSSYETPVAVTGFYERLLERTEALPGVEVAALSSQLPIGGANFDWSFTIEGRVNTPGQTSPNADYTAVSPGYFAAMGIQLLRGRTFTAFDRDSANPVVVINETMARQFWPDEDAVGQRITLFGPPVWHEVVGIVRDVRSRGLVAPARATMFLSDRQMAAFGQPFRTLYLSIRTTGDPMPLLSPMQSIFRELDATVPFARVRTIEQIVSGSLSQERFSMLLLGIFATMALSLAAIGIYGVMSYSVVQRAQEIGIRMALGADRKTVRRLIVAQGMRSAVAGLGVGLVLAVVMSRGIRSLLFDVTATDPLTYGAVAVLLGAVAYLANYVSAVRASRGDPAMALRSE